MTAAMKTHAPAELRSERGARVLLEPSFELPLIDIEVVLRTGAVHDPASKEGLSRTTARMMRMGTRKRSAQEVEALVDSMGAQLGAEVATSYTRFRGTVLERNLEAFAQLLGELLSAPAFRASDLARVKRETLADLTESLDNDRALAGRNFRSLLFGKHAYGRSIVGRPDAVRAIQRADLVAHHKAHYVSGNLIIGVAGPITPHDVQSRILRHLDRLPEGKAPAERLSAPKLQRGRRIRVVDKPERTQTQILVGTLGVAAKDPHYLPLLLANTVFGGTFTSRLMQEVRAKRGWSYGASSSVGHDRQRDAWSMYTFPAIGDAARCLALQLGLLDRWVERGISSKEHRFCQGYLTRSHAFDIDTAAKRLDARVDIELFGLPKDLERNFSHYIGQVSRTRANEAITQHISTRDLSIVVVATADQVVPQLERLPGVTQVEVVPFDRL